MKKNLYFVLQLGKNGHHVAMAVAVPTNQNLYHHFDDFNCYGRQVEVVHYVETWKQALELESAWNDGFRKNGTIWQKEDY